MGHGWLFNVRILYGWELVVLVLLIVIFVLVLVGWMVRIFIVAIVLGCIVPPCSFYLGHSGP